MEMLPLATSLTQIYVLKCDYFIVNEDCDSARARAPSMSAFHGRSFAREDLKVGNKVMGANFALSGRIGNVREVIGASLERRYHTL
jgi:hypothetical protein